MLKKLFIVWSNFNMSKKIFYSLIIIFIILGVIWGMWFFKQQSQKPKGQTGVSLREFFPFMKKAIDVVTNTGQQTNTEQNQPADQLPEIIPPQPKLRKISSMPIAGAVIFEKERLLPETNLVVGALDSVSATTTETQTPVIPEPKKKGKAKVVVPPKPKTELVSAVRYVEKERGHSYETYLDVLAERKISNTTIPRIHEAFFGNNGQNVLLRYLGDNGTTINTYSASLPIEVAGGDATMDLKGSFMPTNISDVSIAPDMKSMFYLMPYSQSIIGTISLFAGGQKIQIFNSEFTEWLSQWPATRTIMLTTKPSYVYAGSAYIVDTQTKSINNVLSEISGLTTLMSPNGKSILYSESIKNGLRLKLFKMDTREFIDLGVKTLPEKCVWGSNSEYAYCGVPRSLPQANYPDNWYQGLLSFSDDIWKLDLKTNVFNILANPEEIAGESIDVIKPSLDTKENYLIFTNKKDSFLWGLTLSI